MNADADVIRVGVEPEGYEVGSYRYANAASGVRWGFRRTVGGEWRGGYATHLEAVYAAWDDAAGQRAKAWTQWAKSLLGMGFTDIELRARLTKEIRGGVRAGARVAWHDFPRDAMGRSDAGNFVVRRGDRGYWVNPPLASSGWGWQEGGAWNWTRDTIIDYGVDLTIVARDLRADIEGPELQRIANGVVTTPARTGAADTAGAAGAAGGVKVGDSVPIGRVPDNALALYSDGDIFVRREDSVEWVRVGGTWCKRGCISIRQYTRDAKVLALDVPKDATITQMQLLCEPLTGKTIRFGDAPSGSIVHAAGGGAGRGAGRLGGMW